MYGDHDYITFSIGKNNFFLRLGVLQLRRVKILHSLQDSLLSLFRRHLCKKKEKENKEKKKIMLNVVNKLQTTNNNHLAWLCNKNILGTQNAVFKAGSMRIIQ